MPKIAPKSDDKDNHCLVYLDTSPFTTVFFFYLIPLPLTKEKSITPFHPLYHGVRYLVSIYNLHRISLLTMSLLFVALG